MRITLENRNRAQWALFRFSNVNFCDHDAIARFAMAVACLSDRVAKMLFPFSPDSDYAPTTTKVCDNDRNRSRLRAHVDFSYRKRRHRAFGQSVDSVWSSRLDWGSLHSARVPLFTVCLTSLSCGWALNRTSTISFIWQKRTSKSGFHISFEESRYVYLFVNLNCYLRGLKHH